MNHSVKRRRQALHKTHHHYYLNISVEAANLSDWRIESNRIETFLPELECSTDNRLACLMPAISVAIIFIYSMSMVATGCQAIWALHWLIFLEYYFRLPSVRFCDWVWFDDFALLQFLTANFSENVSSHSVQALPESHMDGCVRVCVTMSHETLMF